MYVLKFTDYDNFTDLNITLSNCTKNDNNVEIIIPLFTIIPCGMSLGCLISFMACTLIKSLIGKKENIH